MHGTSMGGMVAIVFAAKYPEKVIGLVIGCCMARYDTMARLNKQVWKAVARTTGMSADLAALIATQAFSREFLDGGAGKQAVARIADAFATNDRDLWIHFCELLEEADLTSVLANVQAPNACTEW
jgi:pimeloyl-ACP methyl ester carboxylesterase